jgi:hypothetical protein
MTMKTTFKASVAACFVATFVLIGDRLSSQQPSGPPPEDPQLVYARAIPGFGGFFIDDQGAPTVYLRDARDRGVAANALGETLRSLGVAQANLRVRVAQYEFRQLQGWLDALSGRVFRDSGVVFVDVDEGANRLRIGIERAETRSAIVGALSSLNIPSDAVIVDIRRSFIPYIRLNQTVRPTLGGLRAVSAAGVPGCTLGFNILLTEKGNTTDNRRSFIMNSHCTDIPGGEEGTLFGQPGGGGPIGTEVDDPDYFDSETFLVCPSGFVCRFSDSARILYLSTVPSSGAAIARPTQITTEPPGTGGTGEITINGTFRIASERSQPVQGMSLNKVGALTGWTVGKVTNTCAHVPMIGLDGQKRFFFCQGMVEGLARPGDSGAAVFELGAPPGRNANLNGILVGGDQDQQFFFSPMANIEYELGQLTVFSPSPDNDQQTPDLVPERKSGSSGAIGFCRQDAEGDLIVRVRNQTNIPALKQTTTRVLFSPGGLREQQTPPIIGGAATDVSFVIPASCFNPDCDFTIAVDASLDIDESPPNDEITKHETNNVQIGRCIG